MLLLKDTADQGIEEYLIEVAMDGVTEQLKTFAYSVNEVIDAMVVLESVERIFNITRTKDGRTWKCGGAKKFDELRKIRKLFLNEASVAEALRETTG